MKRALIIGILLLVTAVIGGGSYLDLHRSNSSNKTNSHQNNNHQNNIHQTSDQLIKAYSPETQKIMKEIRMKFAYLPVHYFRLPVGFKENPKAKPYSIACIQSDGIDNDDGHNRRVYSYVIWMYIQQNDLKDLKKIQDGIHLEQ